MPSYNHIAKEAFEKIFPEQTNQYDFVIKYSAKFSGYNANIRLRTHTIIVGMSKKWRGISKEIQIGLIQELLLRLFKKRVHTLNMDLYHLFLKKIHVAIPKLVSDQILEMLFDKLNKEYLGDVLERPNLKWGSYSTRRLGSYEFGSDQITLSRLLHPDEGLAQELLEYVLYHEMLHKKFKFDSYAGHTRSHTSEFRKWESRFPNAVQLEKQLSSAVAAKRPRSLLRWF